MFQAEASAQVLKWEEVYRLGLMKEHQCYKKNHPWNRATHTQAEQVGKDQAPSSPLQGFKMYLKSTRKRQVTSNHPQYSGPMAMMKSQEKRTFKVFSKMKKKFFSKLSSMSSSSILCLSFTCHWSHCLNKGSTFVFSDQTRASGGLPWWTSTCQCRGHGFLPWSRQISHSLGQLGPCATTQSPRAATIEARTP